MTVTFVVNYMNHHQLPFSEEMMRLTEGGYTAIVVEPAPEARLKLGYTDMNKLPFVMRAYDGEESYQACLDKILNDDMVIFGSCPDELVSRRAQTGKPFMLYSERFFKKGTYRRFIPTTYRKIHNRMLKHEGENVSIICSSAYLPYDLYLLKKRFKLYKWGYFPKTNEYEQNTLISQKTGEKIRLLWVARLIPWKHPEDAVEVAHRLKRDGYDISLDIVGDGPMMEKLRTLVEKKDLSGQVHLTGAKTPEEVRSYMERANVFMFTSDYNEGWGAVMNEAMNSGCAVVASHAVGSVPFLVKHGENGLVYRSGDVNDLYACVKSLCDDPAKREALGRAAYETVTGEWSAATATGRLHSIIEAKINGSDEPVYGDGPCSVAQIISPKYEKEPK